MDSLSSCEVRKSIQLLCVTVPRESRARCRWGLARRRHVTMITEGMIRAWPDDTAAVPSPVCARSSARYPAPIRSWMVIVKAAAECS
jgi:hypothetical protein